MPEDRNMYNTLRLSAGGGLNHTMEKVPQAEDTASIAIGIGGTGLASLRMLKKTIYERVKQDNYDRRETEAPRYDRIKFMLIDSDDTKVNNPLPELDFSADLEYIGIPNVVMELNDKRNIRSKPYLNWLNVEQMKAERISQGAGGIRQVGKYLLSKKANYLYNKIRNMITEGVTGLPEDFKLNIYIMAGIGGGTGSGCFIDVCYIVNQVLIDMQYDGKAAVLGFFFLPDVNLSDTDFPLGGPHEVIVKENGYAALKELDYLMNLSENGDVFEQVYDATGFKVGPMSKPPVNFCHLLSTKSVGGAVIKDGYNYILNVVAEYILNFVVKVEEYAQDGQTSGISLQGIMANIDGLVSHTYKGSGAIYKYNILGASCATVPYREIGTYLAIKFFESIKYISYKMPSRADVQAFCQKVGLDFMRLDMDIKAQTPVFNLDAKNFDTRALKAAQVGEISAPLAEYCNNWKNSYANQRTANIRTIGRALDSYNITQEPVTMAGKVFKELISITKDPNLGPFFAANMLQHAQNHTIASEVDGIREQASETLKDAQDQTEYRLRSMNDAQSAFRSAMADPFDTKKKKYVHEVELWYRNIVEIETYTAFINLMDTIKSHLDKIEEEFFEKYKSILDKLIKTFEDNAKHFNTHGMGNRMYTWSIVNINDIKGDLDKVIAAFVRRNDNNELVAPALVETFNKEMLKNTDKWFDENEIKISELISNFIREKFAAAMSKTMKQYLQEKHKKEGQELIDVIEKDVIYEGLVSKAKPMFSMDQTIIDISNLKTHAEYILLNIPNTEGDFAEAAKQCRSNRNLQMGISQTVLTDRIFMLEFFSGIPLYAYLELRNYESVYYDNKTPCTHLNEGKEKNWKALPSPIPATYNNMLYTRVEQEKVDEEIALYEDAKSLGVISENAIDNIMTINIFKPIDFEEILLDGWDANAVSCNKALQAAEKARESLKDSVIETIEILSPNFDETHLDKFVYMPVYVKKTRNEVEKLKKLDETIEMIRDKGANVQESGSKQAAFMNALLYSVITNKGQNYKFCYVDSFEEEQEVVLNKGIEGYGDIPVYAAYKGYLDLDREIVDLIAEITEKTQYDITDEMINMAVNYQNEYKRMRPIFISAAQDGSHLDADEIEKFLNDLYRKFDMFIKINGGGTKKS